MLNKYQSGQKFKRLDIKGLMADQGWKHRKLNVRNLEVMQDSMQARGMSYPQRVAVLSQAILENGGETGEHGNGAFGIMGWRGDRRIGLRNNIHQQTHRLMEDIYNNGNYREWTHGGKGTGVQTGREMQQLYRNTKNTKQAVGSLMKGYVRPPKSVMQERYDFINTLSKYMK